MIVMADKVINKSADQDTRMNSLNEQMVLLLNDWLDNLDYDEYDLGP